LCIEQLLSHVRTVLTRDTSDEDAPQNLGDLHVTCRKPIFN
jgi:hypothetical protein